MKKYSYDYIQEQIDYHDAEETSHKKYKKIWQDKLKKEGAVNIDNLSEKILQAGKEANLTQKKLIEASERLGRLQIKNRINKIFSKWNGNNSEDLLQEVRDIVIE